MPYSVLVNRKGWKLQETVQSLQAADYLSKTDPLIKKAKDFLIIGPEDEALMTMFTLEELKIVWKSIPGSTMGEPPNEVPALAAKLMHRLQEQPVTMLDVPEMEPQPPREVEEDVDDTKPETTKEDETMQTQSASKKKKGAPPKKSAPSKRALAKKTAAVKAAVRASEPKKATKRAARVVDKSEWPTPFRPGTKKEKAFKMFSSNQKSFDKLERGDKGEWVAKKASELDVEATTLSSWINGQFKQALN